eukprot:COSAG04_NODE_18405_length_442_cov_5.396501_2_plen_82_part_01
MGPSHYTPPWSSPHTPATGHRRPLRSRAELPSSIVLTKFLVECSTHFCLTALQRTALPRSPPSVACTRAAKMAVFAANIAVS